jgi:hypothetical protein
MVRTKFYWYLAGGPEHIVKTGSRMRTTDEMTFQYLKFSMTGQEKSDLLIQVTA